MRLRRATQPLRHRDSLVIPQTSLKRLVRRWCESGLRTLVEKIQHRSGALRRRLVIFETARPVRVEGTDQEIAA